MPSRMAEILAVKKKEIEDLKNKGVSRSGTVAPLPIRDFKDALSTPDQTALIAEIKFASPSAGVIREREDPRTIGGWYAAGGARMIYELEGRKDGISRISDFVHRLKKALGPDRQVKAPNRNTTGISRSLAGWTSAFPP
jgi:hypothetical protein